MGNHQAGAAMVQTAMALYDQRDKTGQSAMEILDIACEPWKNRDAEFDEEDLPHKSFGKLLIEAFAEGKEFRPGYVYDPEGDDADFFDWWSDNVLSRFSQRYDLY